MNELRSLVPYLKPYRWVYLLGLTLVVASNFFATLGPRFLQHGIDALRRVGSSIKYRVPCCCCWP